MFTTDLKTSEKATPILLLPLAIPTESMLEMMHQSLTPTPDDKWQENENERKKEKQKKLLADEEDQIEDVSNESKKRSEVNQK